jgi:iron complex outermembrane receptor protein
VARFRRADVQGPIGDTKGDGKTPTQNVGEYNAGTAAVLLSAQRHRHRGELESRQRAPASLNAELIFGDQNIDVKDQKSMVHRRGYMLNSGVLTDLKLADVTPTTRANRRRNRAGSGPGAFDPRLMPVGFQLYPSDFGDEIGSGFPAGVWFYSAGSAGSVQRQVHEPRPGLAVGLELELPAGGKGQRAVPGLISTVTAGAAISACADQRGHRRERRCQRGDSGSDHDPAFGPYLPTEFKNTYDDFLPSGNIHQLERRCCCVWPRREQ